MYLHIYCTFTVIIGLYYKVIQTALTNIQQSNTDIGIGKRCHKLFSLNGPCIVNVSSHLVTSKSWLYHPSQSYNHPIDITCEFECYYYSTSDNPHEDYVVNGQTMFAAYLSSYIFVSFCYSLRLEYIRQSEYN